MGLQLPLPAAFQYLKFLKILQRCGAISRHWAPEFKQAIWPHPKVEVLWKTLLRHKEPKLKVFNVVQSIEFVVNSLSPLAQDKNQFIQIDKSADEGNSLKFSPQGSPVFVRYREIENKNQIEIEIEDRGPGISDKDKAQAFQPGQTLSWLRHNAKHENAPTQNCWELRLFFKKTANVVSLKVGQ